MIQDDKITVEELAKRLKEKYPQYKLMDDQALVDKVISKYPEYQNVLKKKDSTEQNLVRQIWKLVVWTLQRLKIRLHHT